MVIKGQYAYVAYLRVDYAQTRITRINLEDYSLTHLILNTSNSSGFTNGLVADNKFLYAWSAYGTTNYIRKINLDTFTLHSTSVIGPTGQSIYQAGITKDSVEVNNYIYTALHGSYPSKYLVRVSKEDTQNVSYISPLFSHADHQIYCIRYSYPFIYYTASTDTYDSEKGTSFGAYNPVTGANYLFEDIFEESLRLFEIVDGVLYVTADGGFPVTTGTGFLYAIPLTDLKVVEQITHVQDDTFAARDLAKK